MMYERAGYVNQPITYLMTQDISFLKAFSELTADLLKRLGINVNFVATDWVRSARRHAKIAGSLATISASPKPSSAPLRHAAMRQVPKEKERFHLKGTPRGIDTPGLARNLTDSG